jgi:hypothetical protein
LFSTGAAKDLLLIGGAGAGQRSICELAAAHHAHSGLRVLIVTHDRESAERCLERLALYRQIGLRCGVLEQPSELAKLDLAVAPLASASILLASDEPVRCGLGLVIIEELEVVADAGDSELWPLLLLRCQALKEQDLPLRLMAICGDVLLGERLAKVLRAEVVRAFRGAKVEPANPSLQRARALLQLRGGLLSRRANPTQDLADPPAAVHAVRPR